MFVNGFDNFSLRFLLNTSSIQQISIPGYCLLISMPILSTHLYLFTVLSFSLSVCLSVFLLYVSFLVFVFYCLSLSLSVSFIVCVFHCLLLSLSMSFIVFVCVFLCLSLSLSISFFVYLFHCLCLSLSLSFLSVSFIVFLFHCLYLSLSVPFIIFVFNG